MFRLDKPLCDLDLKVSTPIFHMTLGLWWCITISRLFTKCSVAQKKLPRYSLIFEPSLWPCLWKQSSYILKEHSGIWWFTFIPRLVVKGWAVHEIQWKQSYFDYIMKPHCDFDFDVSTSVFLPDSQAHDDALPYQVWLQQVERFRKCRQVGRMDRQRDRRARRFQYTPPHPLTHTHTLTHT